jgi:uncharacterized 2Fe-2S/4Fe-4S cluster protein (DUF4445 family)
MTHRLTVREGSRIEEIEVEAGTLLIDSLAGSKGARIEVPCGGKGLCGKCRVRLLAGALCAPGQGEGALLSAAELGAGFRLACLARVEGDAEIEVPTRGEASIVTAGPATPLAVDPPVRLVVVTPRESSLQDQSSDEERLLDALALELERQGAPLLAPARVALGALPGLARHCREGAAVAALVAEGEVLDVAPLRPGSRSLGVGVDVGTTTVVCRLVDLSTGEFLGSASELNAQGSFGADVISRIGAASGPGGLEALQVRITSQVSEMAASLARRANAAPEDLACLAISGNSTMLHLLAGVPPEAMARTPFAPAFLGRRIESAAALGLCAHRGCAAILLQGVSAFVGADIVAGMAAIGLHEASGRSLYLDMGTNGEIAFGGSFGILCCATAAGPAFEGAGIERGSGGVRGAIDSVWMEDGAIRFGTIGDTEPTGICGSGLIDALAVFLDCRLVDDTGRMVDLAEARELPPALASLVAAGPRGPLVYLDRERDIYISQADVRAAQLAKAAIAAGIDTLLAIAGVAPAEVDRLYLAGGFGSLLDVRSATRIGLLPRELADRVIVVGNASGAGSTAACLSRKRLEDCDRARAACSYVELSSRPGFNEAYIERMMFPEPT